jgi:hypothetical protein
VNLRDDAPRQNLRPQSIVLNGVRLHRRQFQNLASGWLALRLQVNELTIRCRLVERFKYLALAAGLNRDLNTEKNYCFQKAAAGL